MTTWQPEAIAGFASAAGWDGADLIEAVAVALAASDGADDAARTTAMPPLVTYTGLWQVPEGDPALPADVDLWAPAGNAAGARALWEAAGRSWMWSATWRAGSWRRQLVRATRAATQPTLLQLPRSGAVPGWVLDLLHGSRSPNSNNDLGRTTRNG